MEALNGSVKDFGNSSSNEGSPKSEPYMDNESLASIFHEIRNPIQSIYSIVDQLSNKTMPDPNHIDQLKDLSEHLNQYLKNQLDTLSSGAIAPNDVETNFDLRSLVKSLTGIYQVQAKGGVSVSYSIDPKMPKMVWGNKTALNQVLTNLLSNATKFTAKGVINTIVEYKKKIGNKHLVKIMVADSGIGIPRDKTQMVFDSFLQAGKDTKSKFGGSGLGLSVTKRLIGQMEGTIEVESILGQGTNFTIHLPLSVYHDNEIREIENNDPILSGEGKKILLVDDNILSRKFAGNLLESWGFEVDDCNNGVCATSKLMECKYDFIFMDMHLPGLNGIEITELLRSDPSNPNYDSPVIALTGSILEPEKDQAFAAGVNYWISKPFNSKDLMKSLKDVSTSKKQEGLTFSDSDDDDLTGVFIDQTTMEIEKMKNAMESKSWQQVSSIAHKIKPNYEIVGLNKLSNKAEWIEESVGKIKPALLKSVVDSFIDESISAINNLKHAQLKIA